MAIASSGRAGERVRRVVAEPLGGGGGVVGVDAAEKGRHHPVGWVPNSKFTCSQFYEETL